MEEPYKEVFNLRVFGELSYEKIGTLFQKSSGWVRVTFYRAKKKIEEYYNRGDQIIFTRDTHYDDYLNTLEGRKLRIQRSW